MTRCAGLDVHQATVTGEEVWSKPAAQKLCGTARGCGAGQGAAVTAIPGAVFAVSNDGGVRAHSSADGTIVWQFDTNREFQTVNGVSAHGGAMDGPGVIIANGMLCYFFPARAASLIAFRRGRS